MENVFRRPLLHEVACVHDENAVCDVARTRDVVRDVQKRDALALAQVRHQVEDADSDRDVQHRDRLVRDDQLRPKGERLRKAHALALSSAQLVRKLPRRCGGRREPNLVQNPLDLGAPSVSSEPAAVKLQRADDSVCNAVRRVDRAVRILEHHGHVARVREPLLASAKAAERLSVEVDLTPGRLVDAGKQAGDGALAAAALPDEGHDLSSPDREVDVVDGVQRLSGEQFADAKVTRQPLRA
jgi:hypothetical protein